MARGGNKLKYQVEKSIKKINYIGISKKGLRDSGEQTGIHSTDQIKHALSVSQNFAKWAKQEGIKDLFQLKRAHYRDYIAYMQDTGVSNGHLINIETNLRILAKGMAKISQEKGQKPRDWVPKTRLIDSKSRKKPENRSYSSEQIKSFREKLSDNAKIGADLQQAFGLRLREAANTKVAHIREKEGKLYWVATQDKTAIHSAHGVTKASRPRESLCHPEFETRIHELIQGKSPNEYVSQIKYNSLKSAYNRSGIEGSHSFRHTYAREMLTKDLRIRGIEQSGRNMIQRMLENREKGYRRDRLVRREERPIYQAVNQVIDKIHAYLGHGKGRIDLCEVYMKGI
ncbi:integrase domain-containing protein [Peribacillus loiseleuriae]|uniref:Tyr recombinase domain-containing protein n=1 Tax=Peribacillus loiseleuriae TaxID=1679170 RepID=A0A0K9G4A3_9BACI|nr:integrase domain-containing protein [Peribacillus loiseleuriae]KMY41468.1 hypothetical protein AC625_24940 [Peribacillus loiseleuriae]